MTDKKLTNADVRAKHKEFLFPSVANYYDDEPRRPRERQGAPASSDLDGKSTSTSSAAS